MNPLKKILGLFGYKGAGPLFTGENETIELLKCPHCETPYIEPKNIPCIYDGPCSYCGRGQIKIDYRPEK